MFIVHGMLFWHVKSKKPIVWRTPGGGGVDYRLFIGCNMSWHLHSKRFKTGSCSERPANPLFGAECSLFIGCSGMLKKAKKSIARYFLRESLRAFCTIKRQLVGCCSKSPLDIRLVRTKYNQWARRIDEEVAGVNEGLDNMPRHVDP
eukprot:4509490-Amphidinium_carterae.1